MKLLSNKHSSHSCRNIKNECVAYTHFEWALPVPNVADALNFMANLARTYSYIHATHLAVAY
jgi:hypothetical protein